MTESSGSKVVLSGEDALALWRKGRGEWNKWVENNPVADVDFSNVDFGKEGKKTSRVCFSGYNFPKGNVSFSHASFGEGNVSFERASFGEGNVTFDSANFGEGNVSFVRASFGEGNVTFNNASFDFGVTFQNASFGVGEVEFQNASFDRGRVYFIEASFGEGNVCFDRASFGKCFVSFDGACFGEGFVIFDYVSFGEGFVIFDDVSFGEGNVSFEGASFGEGNVSFSSASFGEGDVSFKYCKLNGHLSLIDLRNCEKIQSLSFKYATFTQSFELSGNNFRCVPDLTFTEKANQFSLEGLICKPNFSKSNVKYSFSRADNKEDIPRLRRLKEIAEENKDHDRALDFHAWEMKAKRWHVNNSFGGLLLDYAYDLFSNYGRSETRPLLGLLAISLVFTWPYFALSSTQYHGVWGWFEKFGETLSFSFGQMIPFIPGSRIARAEGVNALFFGDLSFWIHLCTFFQSLISFGFLFLLGLALRNRFRI